MRPLGRSNRYCFECAPIVKKARLKRHQEDYNRRHPDARRRFALKARYGITLEQYDEMVISQGGCCAICGTTDPGRYDNWHIDHDHACCPGRKSCGKCLRGLLCDVCNRVVLPTVEGPLLDAALAYLARWAP
jgi:hypothetical protein